MTLLTSWKTPKHCGVSLNNGGRTNQSSMVGRTRIPKTFLLAFVAALALIFNKIEIMGAETLSSDNLFQHTNNVIPGDDELDKRGSGFMPMRGRRDPVQDFDDEKRGGFLPSRGKKEQSYYYPEALNSGEDKRGSSFLPMRGRRPEGLNGGPKSPFTDQFLDQLDDGLGYKRAAFMPMRGRKNDKRLQGSFLPMRGRKWSPEANLYDDAGDSSKRASAFTAMRGRKKAMYTAGGSKRLNAFMPMRGKKDEIDPPKSSDSDLMLEDEILVRPIDSEVTGNNSGPDDKRAGSFFGMRGKRYAELATSRPHPKN